VPDKKEEFSVANLLQAQRDLLQSGSFVPGGGRRAEPAADTDDADAFLNIKHYAYMVYGRKWWVLLVTAVVIGAAVVRWAMAPRRYEADAQVILRENMLGGPRTSSRAVAPCLWTPTPWSSWPTPRRSGMRPRRRSPRSWRRA